MALVKLHGRQSFSTSWCVEGGFGIPGDSGAWVYDPVSGGLCGHVLAWGDKSKTAYIAPMEVLFEDIRARLGASTVELPVPCRPGFGANKRPAGVVGQDECLATAMRNSASAELAKKLRSLQLDGGGGTGGAGGNNPSVAGGGPTASVTNQASAGNGPRKKQEVVGVRPLFMAGTVS